MNHYKYYFVYKTTNLINDKIYVGQHSTNNIDDGYLGSGTILNKAIKKYGKENFKREILEFCETFDILCKKEIYWIEVLDAVKNGYNILFEDKFSIKNRGEFNPFYKQKHSKETRDKISIKSKNKPKLTCPYCNKTMDSTNAKKYHFDNCYLLKPPKPPKILKGYSDETRKRISDANKNKIISDYHRSQISKAQKGKIMSTETRNKLSNIKKEYYKTHLPYSLGKPKSIETKLKISQKLKERYDNGTLISYFKGKCLSEETKQKISNSHKGKVGVNKGKHLSDITKDKLRMANLGKTISQETKDKISKNSKIKRQVIQLTMNNEFINSFNSINEASKYTSCNAPAITNCCRHNYSHTKGFKWMYLEEYNKIG